MSVIVRRSIKRDVLVGAWWVKEQQDEAKKSRAEKDDPAPPQYEMDEDYVEDLLEFLDEEMEEDWEIE